MTRSVFTLIAVVLLSGAAVPTAAQSSPDRAEAIVAKAVQRLGGDAYVRATSIVTTGRYSVIRDGMNVESQTFLDIIVFPDKERTEFKSGKVRSIQVNVGNTGWLYDGYAETVKDQTEKQIADFKRGMRNGIDHLVRGYWRGSGQLTYVGRREAGLGRRSDVVRVTYAEDDWVEYEFDSEGLPLKVLFTKVSPEGEKTKEELRFAKFISVGAVTVPLIVDTYSNGKQTSRINFESHVFNRQIGDAVFSKPADIKSAKRDVRF